MSTLDDNWGSMPTPTEAATLLRQHARKHNLPPRDNNFDDAANVIERLQSALEARTEGCAKVADDFASIERHPGSIFGAGEAFGAKEIAAAIRKLQEQS